MHQVLQHLVLVALAVDQVLSQELFGVLQCPIAHRFHLVVVFHGAAKALLRAVYFLQDDIYQDLNLIKWEKLGHDIVDAFATQLSLLKSFHLVVCAILAISEVK